MQKPDSIHASDWEEDLFAVAVRLPAGTRPTLLDAACADAPELRRRIQALLQAHEEAGDLLDSLRQTDGSNPTP